MRDFSSDHRWLSLNTATVRKQGDLLQIIEACARHGIRAIDPWRDQVASVGIDRAARAVRDDIILLCNGGQIAAPEDARFILQHCTALHGFYGASSMERLPVEPAIANRVREFTELSVARCP